MVIFGAGASYDSSPTYPPGQGPPGSGAQHDDFYRPPLAKDLFANRPLFINALNHFSQCKTILYRLRDPEVIRGNVSVESLLQEIEREADTYPRGKQELAAVRCYLQRAIAECEIHWRSATQRITNYLSLLREIERTHNDDQPVCLVTFNYDTLLEDALYDLGQGIARMEDYTDRSRLFRVFKLHGSVNWGQQIDTRLPSGLNSTNPATVLQYLIETAAQLQVSDRFVLCPPADMGLVDRQPVFPAIAIPVQEKQVFQCPRQMVDDLRGLLPQISKIIMIGWRGMEEHFLRLLSENVRRRVFLSIVAGNRDEAEKIRININRSLVNVPPSSTAEHTGFTQFIRTRRAEQILRASVG
jgi:hypothetical protein